MPQPPVQDVYPHKTERIDARLTIEVSPKMQLEDKLNATGHAADARYAGAALDVKTSLGDVKEAHLLHQADDAYKHVTTTQAMVEAVREGSNPFNADNLEHARVMLAARELGNLLKAAGVGNMNPAAVEDMAQSAVTAGKGPTPTSMLGGGRG